MKVICVQGITKSGKTTVCETIISSLTKRGYTVGSVKEIHFEQFKIDPLENTNTNRHKNAGSTLVTARGYYETDIMYPKQLSVADILKHYDHDFVILEGATDINCPKIITAHNTQEIDERIDYRTVFISGVISNELKGEYKGYEIINPFTDTEKLVDKVIEYAVEPLPLFDEKCCSACGTDCKGLMNKVINKTAKLEDCVLQNSDVELYIDGEKINMVPFVQKILKNAAMGVIKELEGSKENANIEIKFKV